MKPAFRKPLLAVHTWVGLTAGLVLLIVAVTGAVLIFRTALERKLDPARWIVAPDAHRLSLDDLAARARAAHPEGELESVRFYGDPTAPVLALFSNKEYVHLNPHTGAVLGIRQRYGEGFGWVEGVHKYLMLAPTLGEDVNGSFAIVFAALTLTGIVLWWPATRRALKAGLTINRKLKGRPWHLNLHKTLGAYVALVILFSAVTGVPIALESTQSVIYFLTGSKITPPPAATEVPASVTPVAVAARSADVAPPTATNAAGVSFAGFQAIADRIESLMPQARETYIALPKKGVVSSYAIATGAPHPNARSYVWFEPATARVLRFTPYAQATTGFRVYYWMLSLHTAVTGGIAVQVILLVGTLSVPVLAYTGVASYLRRKSRRETPAPATGRAVATRRPLLDTP
jgi:uncharacterized iron-regulated membrane protein